MDARIGLTHYVDFNTVNDIGADVNADSTPTCQVYEENNDTPILTPTVTLRVGSTGRYRIPVVVSTGNGFDEDKFYTVYATVTVQGVTSSRVVDRFRAVKITPRDIRKLFMNTLNIVDGTHDDVVGGSAGEKYLLIYDDDDTTTIAQCLLKDKNGNDVVIQGSGPVARNRSSIQP